MKVSPKASGSSGGNPSGLQLFFMLFGVVMAVKVISAGHISLSNGMAEEKGADTTQSIHSTLRN